jgi:hypothetical protein
MHEHIKRAGIDLDRNEDQLYSRTAFVASQLRIMQAQLLIYRIKLHISHVGRQSPTNATFSGSKILVLSIMRRTLSTLDGYEHMHSYKH